MPEDGCDFPSPATMSHRRVNSAGSILSILSCSSEEFSDFYDGPYATDSLIDSAKEVISHNRTLLQEASEDRYRLDELLLGMLDHEDRCSNGCSQTMVGLPIFP